MWDYLPYIVHVMQSAKVGQKMLFIIIFFKFFLYTTENSPMDFSRESRTSTSTS